MIGRAERQTFKLKFAQDLSRDDNLKTTLRRCYKINAHACSMKCFPENENYSNGGMKT